MITKKFAALAASAFIWTAPTYAGDVPMIDMTAESLIGIAPPSVAGPSLSSGSASGIEKAQAINGTPYAVITPTFDEPSGLLSFFRLANLSATTTNRFTVTIVGSPSAQVYGTANIDVPASASLQYSLNELRTLALAGTLTNGDTSFAIYLQTTNALTAYQHIAYNTVNGAFENVSQCSYWPGVDYSLQGQFLINVHTTILAQFGETVTLHNYANTSVTYRASVSDARTGLLVGNFDIVAAANASYSFPFSVIQTAIAWAPTSNQQHANIRFATFAPVNSPYTAVVGHRIFDNRTAANVNVTQICGIFH